MLRNTMLYRKWWYLKRRNIRKIRLLIRLAITALIVYAVILLSQYNIFYLIGL